MEETTIRCLPASYVEFVNTFNEGRYWDSHEVLEQPWLENKSRFYRGMIIYASAFVHAERGNPKGVYNQMTKAEAYLADYEPFYMGVDVDALVRHAALCKGFVFSGEGQAPTTRRHTAWLLRGEALARQFPYHRLQLKDRWIRGDEGEISTN